MRARILAIALGRNDGSTAVLLNHPYDGIANVAFVGDDLFRWDAFDQGLRLCDIMHFAAS